MLIYSSTAHHERGPVKNASLLGADTPLDISLRVVRMLCEGGEETLCSRFGVAQRPGYAPRPTRVVISESKKTVTILDYFVDESGSWYSLVLPVNSVAEYIEQKFVGEDWIKLGSLPGNLPVLVHHIKSDTPN